MAAAGNSSQNNDERPNYPSNYEVNNIIGVSAFTIDDQLATFSSYGPRTVHVCAPGKDVLSTFKGGGYQVYSGTSMATPHVTGSIALALPILRNNDLDEIIGETAQDIGNDPDAFGAGLVRADNMVNRLLQSRYGLMETIKRIVW